MPMTLRYVARSDVGLVRDGNEDSGYAGPRLLAVADGMGGAAAGEVASSATIEELIHVEERALEGDVLEALTAGVVAANDRIRQLISDDPRREGMGTTLTALLWTGGAFGLIHIGDSRAYLLREGQLRQLTHDHTFVQSLVDEGRITMAEAGVHPARSLILRALQGGGDPEPDVEMLAVRGGDRFLVCSDGLTGVVQDDTVREALAAHTDLAEAAGALVELARRGGAPDNVTVVLADVVETEVPIDSDATREAYLVGAAAVGTAAAAKPRRRPGAAMRSLLGVTGTGRPSADVNDPEVLRYAPLPPRQARWRWLRRLVVIAIVTTALWAGANVANGWVRAQYYVGDQAGEVAIFRGLSQEVGPVRLSELHAISDGLPTAALPTLYRQQVLQTITAEDLDHAERIVDDLRGEACAAHEPVPDQQGATRTPPPTAPATPTATQPATPRTPAATNQGSASSGADQAASDRQTTQPPAPTTDSTPLPPDYPGLDCAEW